ncbi:MAG: GxxExxY protein [Ignavibacteriae bacterium]|nr:GxxExxY protein [Ignavibacteriota bacterium]MCB9243992.1 GxxExxY protein [Ignavibacteriales bacterium]
MNENELAKIVVDKALKVHKVLGPGLLESAYEECLYYELAKAGLKVERQKPMPLKYEDVSLDCGYRLDILVNDKLIIEIKAVEKFNNIYFAQLLSYLRLSNLKLGLLINFNVTLLKDGIKRIANNL